MGLAAEFHFASARKRRSPLSKDHKNIKKQTCSPVAFSSRPRTNASTENISIFKKEKKKEKEKGEWKKKKGLMIREN